MKSKNDLYNKISQIGLVYSISTLLIFGSKILLEKSFSQLDFYDFWVISVNSAAFLINFNFGIVNGLPLALKKLKLKSQIITLLNLILIILIISTTIFEFNTLLIPILLFQQLILLLLLSFNRIYSSVLYIFSFSLTFLIFHFFVYLFDLHPHTYLYLNSILLIILSWKFFGWKIQKIKLEFTLLGKFGFILFLINVIHGFFINYDKVLIIKENPDLTPNNLFFIALFPYLIYPSGLLGNISIRLQHLNNIVFSKKYQTVILIFLFELLTTLLIIPFILDLNKWLITYLLISKFVISCIQFFNMHYFTLDKRILNLKIYVFGILLYLILSIFFPLIVSLLISTIFILSTQSIMILFRNDFN